VDSETVGAVEGEGDGEAMGGCSVDEQPDAIKDRTTRKEMIQCFRDIVDPFDGFDHEATVVRISMPPNESYTDIRP